MATTYTLISSQTLNASAASVTFSSIPNTYTDLILRGSSRTDGGRFDNLYFRFSGLSTTIYSSTGVATLANTGSTTMSRSTLRYSNNNTLGVYVYTNGATATASTFNEFELYIPSYTASASKPTSYFGVAENNTTYAAVNIEAGLFRDNGAVSSILISSTGGQLVSGSSFYLYGIKNS